MMRTINYRQIVVTSVSVFIAIFASMGVMAVFATEVVAPTPQQLQGGIDKNSREIATLDERVTEVVNGIHDRIDSTDDEIETLKAEIEALKEKEKQLTKRIKTHTGRIVKLEKAGTTPLTEGATPSTPPASLIVIPPDTREAGAYIVPKETSRPTFNINNDGDAARGTFTFDVEAVGTDVYIPSMCADMGTMKVAMGTGVSLDCIATSIAESVRDTSTQKRYYRINEGDTETFTIHIAVSTQNNGWVKIQLESINWARALNATINKITLTDYTSGTFYLNRPNR